jgi:hypothetical protein
MWPHSAWRTALVVTVALTMSCTDPEPGDTDGATTTDGPVASDSSGLPDGYGPLWPCTAPGSACNAHDPCAINPVCGTDKLCHPTNMQNCSDKLACTQDLCKGLGLCENSPVSGTCVLPVRVGGGAGDGGAGSDAGVDAGGGGTTELRCFNNGDRDPGDTCRLCDTSGDPKKWTPANGGSCDDGDACTKDDYCQTGLCKGTQYGSQCADTYACTQDVCDGKGGCLGNTLKSDACLINGVCHKDGDNHPAGTCLTCDVKQSQSVWTPITNTCTIGGKCFKQGDKHPQGCAECNPSASATAWTVTGTTHCLINNTCLASGAKDSSGCAACAPITDKYAYTPLPNMCKIGNTCYSKGAKHAQGCAECDPSASATAWTVTGTTHCLINNTCLATGTKDSSGCAACAPITDKYAYTPLPNMCKIGNTCYSKGATHPNSCAECDPATSATSWTLLASATGCLISGECYTANQTMGCFKCDPTTSKTSWTQIAGCTSMDLDVGKYKNTYSSSSSTRGFWFTAPVAFTIIGLRVPTDVGTEVQNVEVLKFTAAPPIFPSSTTSFTSLAYHKGVAGTGYITVNIAISKGDIIGILGARGTTSMKNSYAQTPTYATTISGQSATLARLILQANLNTAKATAVSHEPTSSYSRVEVRYKP